MIQIPSERSFAGKANTVLLFGHGENATAVISTVLAHVHEQSHGKPLHYSGPVRFTDKTVEHVEEVVLRILNSILTPMALRRQSFDMSIVNLSAASVNDIGLNISGFSGDCAVLLAMLSASLQMEVQSNIVSTGHIASPAGEIRMVKGLPAKLEASINSDSVNTFIHPALDSDSSMKLLSPTERERAADALMRAKRALKIVSVRDINELVQAVFTDEQIVLASLRKGFYDGYDSRPEGNTPALQASNFLTRDNEHRFWTVLERRLLAGRSFDTKELLHALTQFFLLRNVYPKEIGNQLFKLIASLPPETRRFKTIFPLLPIQECIRLSQFAMETDLEDVLLLFKSVSGEGPVPLRIHTDTKEAKRVESGTDPLQLILSEMDTDHLTSLIGLPIDSARAAYIMNSVTLESYDQFIDSITSFYIHIMRHYRKISEPVDPNAAGSEALKLLEEAFSKEGGLKGALAEARHGTKGGLKFIFDSMTQELKRQEQEKRINYTIKSTLDPLHRESKLTLMESLLEHLKPVLPPDILSQPSEMFVDHYESIVRTYVRSFAQMKYFLRSL
jgi:hypothetical protein